MDRVTVDLENCYGIAKLEHVFDFTTKGNKGAFALYAPNGVMKSSLAETFKDASVPQPSKDRIFPKRKTSRKITDDAGKEIEGERILVVLPYDPEFGPTEKTATLLINDKLRKEYEALHAQIEDAKSALVKAVRQQAGSTPRRDFEEEISTAFALAPGLFEDAVARVKREVERLKEAVFADVKYDIIFNDKVEKALESKDLQEAIGDFILRYNELLAASTYFKKGTFDYYNAAQIAKSLADNGFFVAEHTVNLKGSGGAIEITTQKQLEQLIADEKAKLLSDKKLQTKFDAVQNQLHRNVELREFCRYLQDNEPLVARLNNVPRFKQDVLMSYLKTNEALYNDLMEKIEAVEKRTKEIEEVAQKERTEWDAVIAEFNKRFFVPFVLKIVNRIAVMLRDEPLPQLGFTYRDGRDEVDVEKKQLMEVLSTGERKALYVLNVIFEVRRREKTKQETLIVVDDVADSFDYQNKFAIIQYLKDISEHGHCKLIIMTHNFDFFRTIQSRFVGHDQCLMASKEEDGITLGKAVGVQNVFVNVWKEKFFTDSSIKVACIPFLRNLVEFTKGTGDPTYERLTSLLHWKKDTPSITVGELDQIYNSLCAPPGKSADTAKLVCELIDEQAQKCAKAHASMDDLQNKVVLAIASRLNAEKFMLKKIDDDAFANAIKANQTTALLKEFKKRFATETETISVLDQVALMTPENIHLNSFMYEPLIDMSDKHLKDLYAAVGNLA